MKQTNKILNRMPVLAVLAATWIQSAANASDCSIASTLQSLKNLASQNGNFGPDYTIRTTDFRGGATTDNLNKTIKSSIAFKQVFTENESKKQSEVEHVMSATFKQGTCEIVSFSDNSLTPLE